MNKKELIKYINYTNNEIGQIYHKFAAYYNLSDSISDILYILEMENGVCDQSLLYKLTMVSRQTVSSALTKMQRDGYIVMTPKNGRENTVSLTEKGKQLLSRTETNITMSENNAYDSWSEHELQQYYDLSRRFLNGLRDEFRKLKGKNENTVK